MSVLGKTQYVHRVIWIMHHGDIPDNLEIDHKNSKKYDNRIHNLRLVTKSENQLNRYGRSSEILNRRFDTNKFYRKNT